MNTSILAPIATPPSRDFTVEEHLKHRGKVTRPSNSQGLSKKIAVMNHFKNDKFLHNFCITKCFNDIVSNIPFKKHFPRKTENILLIGGLLTALLMRVINIGAVGDGNLYYSATVFSMLTSLKNFFFVSFDPTGFVSVDKPPLGLWVQAISAKIFGFHGWALLIPQIVAGVLSCLVLYWLVRKYFGPTAGLLAALILALTPIAVATDRNNTIDAMLIFTLLLSAVMLVKAIEQNSLKRLLLGALFIGFGFNIKMLQAYMILPAFFGTYLLCAKTKWWKRLAHLAIAAIVILVISFAWVAAVDLTPAANRPYVGSSQNNSETELITGHNGVSRLGEFASWFDLLFHKDRTMAFQPTSANFPMVNGRPPINPLDQSNATALPGSQRLVGQPPPPGAVSANLNSSETGKAGVLRLFNRALMGQTSWLLPLALLMILIIPLSQKWTWPWSPKVQSVLFWALWLIPMALFFGFAGLFHRYYLEMLSPAVAALSAAGIGLLMEAFIKQRRIGWLLPVSLLASLLFETLMANWYWPAYTRITVLVTLLLGCMAVAGLITVRIFRSSFANAARIFTILAMGSLLILPIQWAITPIIDGNESLPFAGPELLNGSNPSIADLGHDVKLSTYLESQYNGEKFIVAASRAGTVAPIILETKKSAMAFGGFLGSDPILKLDEFEWYIQRGELRFVINNAEDAGILNLNTYKINRWVTENCILVPRSDWSSNPKGSNKSPFSQAQESLYDCRNSVKS
jgi:4-amino-4-deoxy-L-arabinose transferase-like glycosyltransferase